MFYKIPGIHPLTSAHDKVKLPPFVFHVLSDVDGTAAATPDYHAAYQKTIDPRIKRGSRQYTSGYEIYVAYRLRRERKEDLLYDDWKRVIGPHVVGFATNGPEGGVRAVIGEKSKLPIVSAVQKGVKPKPHPATYAKLLEATGIGVDETVACGDTIEDILSAIRARLKKILIRVENPSEFSRTIPVLARIEIQKNGADVYLVKSFDQVCFNIAPEVAIAIKNIMEDNALYASKVGGKRNISRKAILDTVFGMQAREGYYTDEKYLLLNRDEIDAILVENIHRLASIQKPRQITLLVKHALKTAANRKIPSESEGIETNQDSEWGQIKEIFSYIRGKLKKIKSWFHQSKSE